MGRAGKFIPGGARKGDETMRSGPIRAPGEGAPPAVDDKKSLFSKTQPIGGKKPGGGGGSPKRSGSGGGLSQILKSLRLSPIMIGSALFCITVIAVGYYFFYLPSQQQIAELKATQLKQEKEAAEAMAAEKEREKEMQQSAALAKGGLTFDTDPTGAAVEVVDKDAKFEKTTPLELKDLTPGPVQIQIITSDYQPETVSGTINANKVTDLGKKTLHHKIGQLSVTCNRMTAMYKLTGSNDFVQTGTLPANLSNLLTGAYSLMAQDHDWVLPLTTVVIAENQTAHLDIHFPYVNLTLTSTPSGATVREGRRIIGVTPLRLVDQHPANRAFTLDLPLYRVEHLQVELPDEGGDLTRDVTLQRTRDFINSAGMVLVWMREGYWVDKYNVRQIEYEAVMQSNPSTFRHPNHPVDNVRWDEAILFCRNLTRMDQGAGLLPTGYHYTLPTESQWAEFNADANIETSATSRNQSLTSTQDVGYSEPNEYGLYDTIGNVWEWCLDNFDSPDNHSLRGGSWLSSLNNFANSDVRNGAPSGYHDRFTGFRVVLVKDLP